MGKVLLFMEFIPLALTSFPGRLTGDVLCDLSAEGKFSTCPECPHARSAAAHGVEVKTATTNSASLEGKAQLWEVQEGVCLLWDGHRPPGTSTVMAGEQPRLRHQSCKPTSLETSAAKDLGSLCLLSEDLKPSPGTWH